MMFLDANAFYWYYGRQELGFTSTTQQVDRKALCAFLDRRTDLSIPSSVYMEVIVHFRDDAPKLRNIIQFISKKNLRIYNNSLNYCCDPNEFAYLSFMSDSALCLYAHNLLKKKIAVEASFATLFFEVLRLLYLEYRKKADMDLTEKQKGILMYHCGEQWKNEILQKSKAIFENALVQGYAANEEEKSLKLSYIDELNDACIYISLFIELLKNYEDENVDLVKVLRSKYGQMVLQGFDIDVKDKMTMQGLKTEFCSDVTYLKYAQTRIAKIIRKHRYTKMQCDYVQNVLFPAWMENGQKLRKNDIFDMLCVGVLDYQHTPSTLAPIDTTSYLVSFDGKMRKFLNANSSASKRIIDQYVTD